ncbi:MAG: GLPGLI family protein [Flavobacteriaceae bacterium]|nr:GLPGLI family protein [Flavobacteriaceae bacterium]
MKYLLPLIIFIFSFNCIAQQKKTDTQIRFIATYSTTWQPDSLDASSKIDNAIFNLFIFEEGSLYIDRNRLVLDSLMFEADKRGNSISLLSNINSLPKPISNNQILKNHKENELYSLNLLSGFAFKFKENINLMKWKIISETKIINTYKCQKAITNFAGRDYIAWFTSEIPITDGPYKFNGLPGLIVEIYDTKNHYHFQLINFKKSRNSNKIVSLKSFDEAKLISKAEYIKIRDSYLNNPIPMMESEGAVFSEEVKRKIMENTKLRNNRNNNRIELKNE